MKKMKWLGGLAGVLAVAVLASFAVTGCDLELSDKDDRAATASGSDTGSGSEESSTVKFSYTGTVGATDCTSSWWNAHTTGIKVSKGKTVVAEFKNYGKDGGDLWNNAVMELTNGDFTIGTDLAQTNGSSYKEYAIIRTDSYGWCGDINTNNKSTAWENVTNGFDTVPAQTVLHGASYKVEVTSNGSTFDLVKTITGTDGKIYIDTWKNVPGGEDLTLSFTVDNCYLVF